MGVKKRRRNLPPQPRLSPRGRPSPGTPPAERAQTETADAVESKPYEAQTERGAPGQRGREEDGRAE